MATEPIIDPFDAQMPFPLDLRNVRASTAERDIIPSNSRYAGMMVYVQNDEKLYYLKGGVDNSDWAEISEAGATVGLQAVYFNGTLPTTQGNDGDSWFRPVAGKMELYYKLSGTWSKLGEWDTGGTGGGGTWGSITGNIGDQTDLYNALNAKQATLVSGTNIKTVNGTSLLGGGDLAIKAVESIDLTSTVGLVDTYTVTYSDASTYQFTVTNGSNAQSFNFLGNVNDYASLPSSGNVQNDAWYNLTDELLYVYNGTSFPPDGEGISFSGTTPTLQEVVDEGNVINKVIKGVDGVDPEDLVTKAQLDASSGGGVVMDSSSIPFSGTNGKVRTAFTSNLLDINISRISNQLYLYMEYKGDISNQLYFRISSTCDNQDPVNSSSSDADVENVQLYSFGAAEDYGKYDVILSISAYDITNDTYTSITLSAYQVNDANTQGDELFYVTTIQSKQIS